ncbi:hypothetical protein CVV72_18295 [Amycolatopsis sp. TNS106]|nr:hypothetical protein CVV72_18295 [Amycolatopsis sp. TNS106]
MTTRKPSSARTRRKISEMLGRLSLVTTLTAALSQPHMVPSRSVALIRQQCRHGPWLAGANRVV